MFYLPLILGVLLAFLTQGCAPAITDRSDKGDATQQLEYLLPRATGVKIVPLLSVGNRAPNGYRMVGVPDGLGLLDNGDHTFTLFMNHEIASDEGRVRTHGSQGAFISRWIITGEGHPDGPFKVLKGEDAIKELYVWDTNKDSYQLSHSSLAKLCSADLAAESAYYYRGLGARDRLFLTGEERDSYFTKGYGRAFALVVTGDAAGQTYQLPRFGRMSFENLVASPFAQPKTVVAALDDAPGKSRDTMGELYIYVGEKQANGSVIERAGLTNGELYAVAVENLAIEDVDHGIAEGERQRRFALKPINDVSRDDGSNLFNMTRAGNALGVTKFSRLEDGVWDPVESNMFYFSSTGAQVRATDSMDQFLTYPGRIWGLEFDDMTDPLQGGTIHLVVDAGVDMQNPDNMTMNADGELLIQEDIGGSKQLASIWRYGVNDKQLIRLAQFNPRYFQDSGRDFITDNEESSGIIDAGEVFDEGWYLMSIQSHIALRRWINFRGRRKFNYSLADGRELVEDGQLTAIYIPPQKN